MQKSPQALKPADFFALWILYVDLCSAAEAEGHPPIGVNGHLTPGERHRCLVSHLTLFKIRHRVPPSFWHPRSRHGCNIVVWAFRTARTLCRTIHRSDAASFDAGVAPDAGSTTWTGICPNKISFSAPAVAVGLGCRIAGKKHRTSLAAASGKRISRY